MNNGIWAVISRAIPLSIIVNSATATAAPLNFDCDVPPDHYSSVSQDLTGTPAISGTVEAVQLRTGNNMPVAGALLGSVDGTRSVGVQLVAAKAGGKQFDIVLNIKRDERLQRNTLGRVDAGAATHFSLSLGTTGKVTLEVGSEKFTADFVPMTVSKAMVFCSTGQFKFSDLVFSGSNKAD